MSQNLKTPGTSTSSIFSNQDKDGSFSEVATLNDRKSTIDDGCRNMHANISCVEGWSHNESPAFPNKRFTLLAHKAGDQGRGLQVSLQLVVLLFLFVRLDL
ncbi:hypothetical protein L1987_88342 [Smallanthus sonchifolius]|nr:hypothetical protein L1987_88342 [Smallanthus sonchifolius]